GVACCSTQVPEFPQQPFRRRQQHERGQRRRVPQEHLLPQDERGLPPPHVVGQAVEVLLAVELPAADRGGGPPRPLVQAGLLQLVTRRQLDGEAQRRRLQPTAPREAQFVPARDVVGQRPAVLARPPRDPAQHHLAGGALAEQRRPRLRLRDRFVTRVE